MVDKFVVNCQPETPLKQQVLPNKNTWMAGTERLYCHSENHKQTVHIRTKRIPFPTATRWWWAQPPNKLFGCLGQFVWVWCLYCKHSCRGGDTHNTITNELLHDTTIRRNLPEQNRERRLDMNVVYTRNNRCTKHLCSTCANAMQMCVVHCAGVSLARRLGHRGLAQQHNTRQHNYTHTQNKRWRGEYIEDQGEHHLCLLCYPFNGNRNDSMCFFFWKS